MRRILIVSNVISFIEKFNTEIINCVKDKLGYEVHVACNLEYMDDTDAFLIHTFIAELKKSGVILHHLPMIRSPFHAENLSAYFKLKEIINTGDYDIIHCHTPVGAMLTRLAARKARKKGTKVIYTAHGFHFYKGAPLLNWLLYYPAERFLSRWTDVLITINKEDHARAQKFKAGRVAYVPGVGIDVEKFVAPITDEMRRNIRAEMGVPDDAILLCSVGELNENKNHALVIRALDGLHNNDAHYCIAGEGENRAQLEALASKLGMAERVHLLGYRSDVNALYKAADVFVFSSLREGLPVALMEAMASGLPCVASRIRGCVDLLGEDSAMLFAPTDTADCRAKIELALASLRKRDYSSEMLPFSRKNVVAQMSEIYIDTSGLLISEDVKMQTL